jgi:sigma-B regulation protein RsbU (phosphoserine phosphatase)
MLRQMNQLIGERRIEGRFMTMCFATWQKGRRKLRIANAGQSQPLLWKGGRCEKLDLTGFPLGLYDDVTYDEWGVTLDPGDVLVFHSDGLAESANAEGQFFGNARLRRLIEEHAALPAAALADRLLGEVAQFSRGLPVSDDRTLVVLRVR